MLFWEQGWKIERICERFLEGIKILEKPFHVLVKKYAQYGLIADTQPSILQQEHYAFIGKAMIENEMTAYQLLHKLKQTYPELQLFLSTVHCARRDLEWVSSTPRYCQLIREINKEKRLKWCQYVGPDDDFKDFIWTD